MLTILLTGGTGFLRSNLLARIVKNDFKVIVLKRSTFNLGRVQEFAHYVRFYNVDRDPLEKVFKENLIDVIIHCATNYGRGSVSPVEIIETNLSLPLQLLWLGETYRISAFINSDTILDKGVNYYSLSKKQFLDWLTLFSRKLVCINVALEHFYGPFDDPSKLVTKIILELLHEVERIDLTHGRQKRDFVYREHGL